MEGNEKIKTREENLVEAISRLGLINHISLENAKYYLQKANENDLAAELNVPILKAAYDEIISYRKKEIQGYLNECQENKKPTNPRPMNILHIVGSAVCFVERFDDRIAFIGPVKELVRLEAILREYGEEFNRAADLYEDIDDIEGADRCHKLAETTMWPTTEDGHKIRKERLAQNDSKAIVAIDNFITSIKDDEIMQVNVAEEVSLIRKKIEALLES